MTYKTICVIAKILKLNVHFKKRDITAGFPYEKVLNNVLPEVKETSSIIKL